MPGEPWSQQEARLQEPVLQEQAGQAQMQVREEFAPGEQSGLEPEAAERPVPAGGQLPGELLPRELGEEAQGLARQEPAPVPGQPQEEQAAAPGELPEGLQQPQP